MSPKLIPSSSQTVGPYFHIGLEYLVDSVPSAGPDGSAIVTIHGAVLDRDRAPLPDAMLEFWMAASAIAPRNADSREAGFVDGFRRVATDFCGRFSVAIPRPVAVPFDDHTMQAPHLLVLIFARGLLRHLISRVYFEAEPANASDPLLLAIPAERRHTLIAQADGKDLFCWDVILQGSGETVFFAW